MFSSLAPSLALKASQTLTRHKAPTGHTLTSRKQQIKDTLLGLSAGSLALLIALCTRLGPKASDFVMSPKTCMAL